MFIVLMYCSCTGNDEEKLAEWHETTKEEILDQADETPDSTFEHIDLNNGLYEKWYYYEGSPVKYEVTDRYRKLTYAAIIATDTNFRLVKEYCTNGKLSFEGIEYQRKPYGLATWYDCETGKISMQGYRIKFKKTGKWRQYNPDGSLQQEVEYKGKIKPAKLPRLE